MMFYLKKLSHRCLGWTRSVGLSGPTIPGTAAKFSQAGWLRPATEQEVMTENRHQRGNFLMSEIVRFSTSRPITEEEARRVFTSVYRKTPNLRMCLGYKGDELWVREMPKEKIIFEMIPNADINKEYHDMVSRQYDIDTGPLWAAHLLPWAPSQAEYLNSAQDLIDDPKESPFFAVPKPPEHPHVYHVVSGSHHGLSDGFSLIIMTRLILALIDRIIDGKNIDDTVQVGTFFDVNKKTKVLDDIANEFRKNGSLLEARRKATEECKFRPQFLDAFPVVPCGDPKTINIPNSIEEKEASKFISLCKKNDVTVHTGFCSIVDAAIVEMLSNAGVKQSSYRVSVNHCVNHRALFENSGSDLGNCVGAMKTVSDVPHNINAENFWSYAQKNHAIFKDRFKHKASLEEIVLREMCGDSVEPLQPGQKLEPTIVSYNNTNMMDMTSAFGNCGKHVKLEWFDGMTSIHHGNYIWMHTFYSYEGRLMHSFYYNSHLMDDRTARKLIKTIFRIMAGIVA